MTTPIPRIRVFAGPNGSGKSTLKSLIPPKHLYVYLNADDIEQHIRTTSMFSLSAYKLGGDNEHELLTFMQNDARLQTYSPLALKTIKVGDGYLDFSDCDFNSYMAAVIVEFIRIKLIEAKESFTFETVMSHPSKIDFLSTAAQQGYRIYLYFVATIDPEININRVKLRVKKGGHNVPEQKIISRYSSSLKNLSLALPLTYRAFLFDNSDDNSGAMPTFLFEIFKYSELILAKNYQGKMPSWAIDYVLNDIIEW